MPYTLDTQLSPTMQIERDLLTNGFSYSEVASRTGAKLGTIKERNRIVYGIDIREAFRSRVEREGIQSRYTADDAFGYWFAGYFDGEGCLTVFYRERGGYPERRVGVQIACREDDADIIRHIHDTIGGTTWTSPQKGTTRPAHNWRIEAAPDLAEIILPIFDTYPLRSKKRLEYRIWRGLVLNQYVNTLGGTSTRVGATVEENTAFQLALYEIRKIRHPATGNDPTLRHSNVFNVPPSSVGG